MNKRQFKRLWKRITPRSASHAAKPHITLMDDVFAVRITNPDNFTQMLIWSPFSDLEDAGDFCRAYDADPRAVWARCL